MPTEHIISVKELESGGWLVNGNMSVPNDPANRHCQDVLEWIKAGNTPEPEPIVKDPEPRLSQDEILSSLSRAVLDLAEGKQLEEELKASLEALSSREQTQLYK